MPDPELAARDFVIGEKVSGRSQKHFLFWNLRPKKAICSGCNPGGCGLQGEARYIKVSLEIPNSPARTGNTTTSSVGRALESRS